MSGFQLVNGLAGLLIVTSLLVITARRPTGSAFYYALQSLVLVAIFLTLGATVGSHELTAWGRDLLRHQGPPGADPDDAPPRPARRRQARFGRNACRRPSRC